MRHSNIRIGVIATNEEMGEQAVEIGKEMGLMIYYEVFEINDPLKYARKLIAEHKVEAIIARNPIGTKLEAHLTIPVITVYISKEDVFRAIKKAGPQAHCVFFFFPRERQLYEERLEDFRALGVTVHEMTGDFEQWFSESDPSRELFESLGITGDAVTGRDTYLTATPSIARFMKKNGINVEYLTWDPFDLRCAYENAIHAIRANRKAAEQALLFNIGLNATNNGFVFVKRKEIAAVNDIFCNLIGTEKGKVIGVDTETLKAQSPLYRKIASAKADSIIYERSKPYSIHKRTIIDDNEEDAELTIVFDVPAMQETEKFLTKSLGNNGFIAKWNFDNIVVKSPAMKKLADVSAIYARSTGNLLIYGESGTGKEVIAQSIHNASTFSEGRFVAINCAALPAELLESELFGYEEGAFSGAKKGGKEGLFEMSHNGTLFLDEIGDMPLSLQPKLLRCIQEKSVCRLGGNKLIHVNNRIIAATNQRLEGLVKKKEFREDLYYRLKELSVTIPPLRERPEDIEALVNAFVRKHAGAETSEEFLNYLSRECSRYDWPGNIRELEGYVIRVLLLCKGNNTLEQLRSAVSSADLMDAGGEAYERLHEHTYNSSPDQVLVSKGTLAEMESQLIKEAYQSCQGDKMKMAQELGIGYTTVWRKIKELRL